MPYHSVYTVVRVMCQVNGGWSFSATGAPKPLKRFTWNLASLITSTVQPTCKIWRPPKMGGWVGIWVKLYPRVLLIIFWFLQHVHSLPREAWIFAQCTQRRVSVVGVFLWGRFAHWVKSFYPQNHFSMGQIGLSFCMGVNRKHPL